MAKDSASKKTSAGKTKGDSKKTPAKGDSKKKPAAKKAAGKGAAAKKPAAKKGAPKKKPAGKAAAGKKADSKKAAKAKDSKGDSKAGSKDSKKKGGKASKGKADAKTKTASKSKASKSKPDKSSADSEDSNDKSKSKSKSKAKGGSKKESDKDYDISRAVMKNRLVAQIVGSGALSTYKTGGAKKNYKKVDSAHAEIQGAAHHDGRLILLASRPLPSGTPIMSIPWPPPPSGEQQLSSVNFMRNDVINSGRRFAAIAVTPDGEWVVATASFDSNRGKDATENEDDLRSNMVVAWPKDSPNDAHVVNPEEEDGMFVSKKLRSSFSKALGDSDYFKVAGLCFVSDNEVLFGVYESGSTLKKAKAGIVIVGTTYSIKKGKFTLDKNFESKYSFDPSPVVGIRSPLGLSGLSYDEGNKRLIITTSYEAGKGEHNAGGYLWTLSMKDFKAGNPPQIIFNKKTGVALHFGNKLEGAAALGKTRIILICDDEDAANLVAPKEKTITFREHTPNECLFYLIDFVGEMKGSVEDVEKTMGDLDRRDGYYDRPNTSAASSDDSASTLYSSSSSSEGDGARFKYRDEPKDNILKMRPSTAATPRRRRRSSTSSSSSSSSSFGFALQYQTFTAPPTTPRYATTLSLIPVPVPTPVAGTTTTPRGREVHHHHHHHHLLTGEEHIASPRSTIASTPRSTIRETYIQSPRYVESPRTYRTDSTMLRQDTILGSPRYVERVEKVVTPRYVERVEKVVTPRVEKVYAPRYEKVMTPKVMSPKVVLPTSRYLGSMEVQEVIETPPLVMPPMRYY